MIEPIDDYDLAFDRAVTAVQSVIPDCDDEQAFELITAISCVVVELFRHSFTEEHKQ